MFSHCAASAQQNLITMPRFMCILHWKISAKSLWQPALTMLYAIRTIDFWNRAILGAARFKRANLLQPNFLAAARGLICRTMDPRRDGSAFRSLFLNPYAGIFQRPFI